MLFVNYGSCLSVALINAIFEVPGDEVSCKLYDRIDDRGILSVGSGGNFLYRFGAQVDIRSVNINGLDPFLWLSQKKRVVIIVRFFR